MERKYPEGIKFKIRELSEVSSTWKFHPTNGSCERLGYLSVGDNVVLKYHGNSSSLPYFLECVDGLVSDFLTEKDIEIMIGEQLIIYPEKPPLGVTPKTIFESQRIQELTRALYEYSYYKPEDMKYGLMLDWTKELFERLENFIKG